MSQSMQSCLEDCEVFCPAGVDLSGGQFAEIPILFFHVSRDGVTDSTAGVWWLPCAMNRHKVDLNERSDSSSVLTLLSHELSMSASGL